MKLAFSSFCIVVVASMSQPRKLLSFVKKHINFILGKIQPLTLVKLLENKPVSYQTRKERSLDMKSILG